MLIYSQVFKVLNIFLSSNLISNLNSHNLEEMNCNFFFIKVEEYFSISMEIIIGFTLLSTKSIKNLSSTFMV